MLKVGLTGGIGAGKSAVARLLAAKGAVVVDADQLAREVLEPGEPGYREVVAEFGSAVLAPDGRLDRPALGRIVFEDPQRLATLNAIVHPRVADRSAEITRTVPADSVVVYDIPLLVENRLEAGYDVVVVVDAPEDIRLERLARHRGMDEAEARNRMQAQASREERLEVADFVIDNSGDLEDLVAIVEELWGDLHAAAH